MDETGLAIFDEEHAEQTIRRVWHDGRWFFSVIDIVGLLTDAPKPRQYWFDMKRYVQDEGFRELSERCVQLKMPSADGKQRITDCADFCTVMALCSYFPAWGRSRYEPADDYAAEEGAIAGVYAITNEITQGQYIGSSRNIPMRFKQHLSLLRRGIHHAKRLQEAWDSAGAPSFQFEILEHVADPRLLSSVEQRYLDTSQPVYNSAAQALNHSGLPSVSPDQWGIVVAELFDSQSGVHSPLHTAIKEAIMVGALRPGPNFHLLLDAKAYALESCG